MARRRALTSARQSTPSTSSEFFDSDIQLQQFVIPNVRPTGKHLGVGSYGSVEELDIGGVACAGKKIHEALIQRENVGLHDITRKYVMECKLLSSLRHPHIVQFLGVCLLPGSSIPVLVMERLLISLDDLLEKYRNIPPALKWSVLADVCKGLVYLHNHTPEAVIHRDLSAGNILLNSAMVAKISDLGNARLVEVGQFAKTLSRVPGTLVYMPPEAVYSPEDCDPSKSQYGIGIDMFSFGHLALYTATQVFPRDLLPPIRPDPQKRGHLVGLTEIERRGKYIDQLHQMFGEKHHIAQLVKQCLDNDPSCRPSASAALQQLEGVRSEMKDPYQHFTKLDMIKLIGQKEDKNHCLESQVQNLQSLVEEKEAALAQNSSDVEVLTNQISTLRLDHSNQSSLLQATSKALKIQRQEVDTLTRELSIQQQLVEAKEEEISANETVNVAVVEKVKAMEEQISAKTAAMDVLGKVKDHEIQELTSQLSIKDQQLSALDLEVQALGSQLSAGSQEIDALRKQADVLQCQKALQVESLQETNAQLANQRERICATEEEIAARDALLESREGVIQALTSKSLRQGQLSTDVSLFHPGTSLQWVQCANLPVGMFNAQAVELNNRVYVGGGDTGDATTTANIYKYDFMADTWATLPSPTIGAALTSYNSQLLLIGGLDASTIKTTNQVWVLQEDQKTWGQSLPALPTARYRPSAVSYQNHLIVSGGKDSKLRYVNVTEVYNGCEWTSTEPLPKCSSHMKSTCHDNTYYLIGGLNQGNSVFYAPLQSLLPLDPQSPTPEAVWKTLPDIAYYFSSIASFGGVLVVVGGKDISSWTRSSSLCVYSPLTRSWLYIGEMPITVDSTCTITLPTGDMLVIGGTTKDKKCSRAVYKLVLKSN